MTRRRFSNCIRKAVLLLTIIGCFVETWAQSNVESPVVTSDTTNWIKDLIGDELYDFTSGLKITNDIDLKALDPMNDIKEKYDHIRESLALRDSLKFNSDVRMEHMVFTGDTSQFYPSDVIFSNLHASTSTNLMSLPVRFQLTVNFLDGHFNRSASRLGLSIDEEGLMRQLRSRYAPEFSVLDHHKKFEAAYAEMTSQITDLTKAKIDYDILLKIVTHPAFKRKQSEFQRRLHNLLKIKDELSNVQQVEVDSLSGALNKFKQLEALFNDSWGKKNQTEESLREMKSEVGMFIADGQKYTDPAYLKSVFKEKFKGRLTKAERFLLYTKQANIGSFTLTNSELTAYNYPLTGIRHAYENDHIAWHIAWGGIAMGQGQPLLTSSIFDRIRRTGNLAFARFVIKQGEDRQFGISAIKADETISNPVDTALGLTRRNLVVALDGTQPISKNGSLDFEVGVSRTKFPFSVTVLEDPNKSKYLHQRLAGKATLRWLLSEKKTIQCRVGMRYTGQNYYTTGNPFLIKNRKGAFVGWTSTMFDGKLSMDFEASYDMQAGKDPEYTNINYVGMFNFNVTPKLTVGASVLPNNRVFRLQNENDLQSESFVYSLYILHGDHASHSGLTGSWTFTNLNSQSEFIDTSSLLNRQYLFVSEKLAFGETRAIELLTSLGTSNYYKSGLTSYNCQLSVEQAFGAMRASIGAHMIREEYIGLDKYGASVILDYAMGERFAVRGKVIYQKPTAVSENGNARNEYIGRLNMQYKF